MNGPNSSDRQGKRFDWMESAMVFAGVLVVSGLFMESWPELKLAIVECRFPKPTVTGAIIVTVGVLIEVILGVFITQRAKREQSISNERVAKAEQAASEANRLAEQERLARVKLERKVADRVLTSEQESRIVEKLSPLGTQHVTVEFNPRDAEVGHLYAQLKSVLELAGWRVALAGDPGETILGIFLGLSGNFCMQDRVALQVLASTLMAEGLYVETIPWGPAFEGTQSTGYITMTLGKRV